MSRLCPIKPLLRQLGDNAYRASPALISGKPRELRYIALGAAHSLLQCISPLLAVRPEGANHQWRKNPPGELSIDPVAGEQLMR